LSWHKGKYKLITVGKHHKKNKEINFGAHEIKKPEKRREVLFLQAYLIIVKRSCQEERG
jgi:hypothetical protein